MASTCPIGFDIDGLRRQVADTYTQVARSPDGEFHFHRGPDYAADLLGYDRAELATLPDACTASFAGVANPLAIAPLRSGEVVLDVGSGSGMDLILAARRVGASGRAIGVDPTPAMRELAMSSARAALVGERVTILDGDTQLLPVEDESVDVVISNGVLNLSTDKSAAFAEIWRVLRPGGRLQLGDVVIGRDLSEGARSDADLWAAWIAGALPVAELVSLPEGLGFVEVRIAQRFDSYRGTRSHAKLPESFEMGGANLFARKPASGR